MARHFRLGTLMRVHYGGRGLVEWYMWLSGCFLIEPRDIKSVFRGQNGQEVKDKATSYADDMGGDKT